MTLLSLYASQAMSHLMNICAPLLARRGASEGRSNTLVPLNH